jgi:uncharacterized membrane protein YkvA (DUF1232 family)
MEMTIEQIKAAHQQFEDGIDNVDNEDILYASRKGSSQLKKFGDRPPKALGDCWDDIKLMVSMVTDYSLGNYEDVEWRNIAAITGAIIYFVSPIDVIPDFIPEIGFLDDALVIKLALDFSRNDFDAYKKWKQTSL